METLLRQDVYDMVKNAVKDGLGKVREWEASGRYIARYFEFPKMELLDSGLPFFSKSLMGEGPVNFDYIFHKDRIDPRNLSSWQQFRELALTDHYLSRFLDIQDEGEGIYHTNEEILEFHRERSTYGTVGSILNRYIHISGLRRFREKMFRSIYQEWERGVFMSQLPLDVFVPILCLKFPFDKLEIAPDGTSIEELSNDVQLGRNIRHSMGVTVDDRVIGAATHALVLKGWSVANKSQFLRNDVLYDVGAFSKAIAKTEQFFAALRAETSTETGYSQLVAVPTGWADHWDAFLPPVHVVSLRAYPQHFENRGWLKSPPELDVDVCMRIGETYNLLSQAPNDRLMLAAKRLNLAFLRSSDEDSILDITIGLETLLASDCRNEITYRLAVRAAALSSILRFNCYSPLEVFDLCKRIYDYRSAVIHGTRKAQQKRTIKVDQKREISAVRLGRDLLGYIIRVLSRNPQYLDLRRLDSHLVTANRELQV